MNAQNIVWIASYPKSGNTWVRAFLNAYVSGAEWEMNAYYGQVVIGDNIPWAYQAVSPFPIQQMPQWGLACFRAPALLHVLASRDWQPAYLKTHNCKVKVAEWSIIPPMLTKSAVYIVRDPRDVCVSWAHHFANDTVDDAIEWATTDGYRFKQRYGRWGYVLGSWREHTETWTNTDDGIDTTVVRYEDMLDDPRGVFADVLKGCGFDIDTDRLNRAVEMSSFAVLQRKEATDGFIEAQGGPCFFRQGKSGAYLDDRSWARKLLDWISRQPDRNRLSEQQVKRIECGLAVPMERFGYTVG